MTLPRCEPKDLADPPAHATFAGQPLNLSSGGKALGETMMALAFAYGPTSTATGAPAASEPFAGSGPLVGAKSLARGEPPTNGDSSAQGGLRAQVSPVSLDGPVASAPARRVPWRDLLLGSSFHVAGVLGAEGAGPGLAALGRVAHASFDGEQDGDDGATNIVGDVATAVLGADADFGRALAGVALGPSEGDGAAGPAFGVEAVRRESPAGEADHGLTLGGTAR
ncbi:MAG: hypothetical protein OXC70_09190 [Gammaproteobacteria bacterium]|nr:hypothetical protein [Gammaproteobacteria bacterium]